MHLRNKIEAPIAYNGWKAYVCFLNIGLEIQC